MPQGEADGSHRAHAAPLRSVPSDLMTAHTRAHAHTRTYARALTHAHARMHAHARLHARARTHARTYTHAPTRTHTRTHLHAPEPYASTHIHTHTYKRTPSHAHTHPHPHARTQGGERFVWIIGDSVARGLAVDVLRILQAKPRCCALLHGCAASAPQSTGTNGT
jgi:hypothetical protein